MELPTPRVIIFEDNATRAELYAHWLDAVDVTVATTRRQAIEALEDEFDVAVLDEDFADGNAKSVLEAFLDRNPSAQVATTARERGKVVPSLDVDTHMAKPVFEEDLREAVDRLAKRAVYAESLAEYFRLTMELTSAEVGEAEGDADRDVGNLRERVGDLKPRLSTLVGAMDGDDVKAVLHDLTERAEPAADIGEQRDSKYVPPKCPNCNVRWNDEPDAGGPVSIGSFVWRCGDCGHVQLHGGRKEGDVAAFL